MAFWKKAMDVQLMRKHFVYKQKALSAICKLEPFMWRYTQLVSRLHHFKWKEDKPTYPVYLFTSQSQTFFAQLRFRLQISKRENQLFLNLNFISVSFEFEGSRFFKQEPDISCVRIPQTYQRINFSNTLYNSGNFRRLNQWVWGWKTGRKEKYSFWNSTNNER